EQVVCPEGSGAAAIELVADRIPPQEIALDWIDAQDRLARDGNDLPAACRGDGNRRTVPGWVAACSPGHLAGVLSKSDQRVVLVAAGLDDDQVVLDERRAGHAPVIGVADPAFRPRDLEDVGF